MKRVGLVRGGALAAAFVLGAALIWAWVGVAGAGAGAAGKGGGGIEAVSAPKLHTFFQVSIINALLQGGYDGPMTIGGLRRHGDFGIGTLNGLDGELLAFDGHFWQVRSDGSVHSVEDSVGVPFAAVTHFRPMAGATIEPAGSMAEFGLALDRHLTSVNTVIAVRIHGTFPYLKARSVPRQTPPYRPLAQVVEDQSVFEFRESTGTLVGFRTPLYMQGLNVPGYHFHFLSDDGTRGGHVLDLRTGLVRAELDYARSVEVELPETEGFSGADVNRDMSRELHKVEQ